MKLLVKKSLSSRIFLAIDKKYVSNFPMILSTNVFIVKSLINGIINFVLDLRGTHYSPFRKLDATADRKEDVRAHFAHRLDTDNLKPTVSAQLLGPRFSLDPGEAVDFRREDEIEDHTTPAVVMWLVEVVFRCDFRNFRQKSTWHVWEVVMLVVIPDVVGDIVQRPVIGIRFLPGNEFEVFCDEMSGHRVHAKPKDGT